MKKQTGEKSRKKKRDPRVIDLRALLVVLGKKVRNLLDARIHMMRDKSASHEG